MIFMIPEELKQRVLDATILLPHRIKILENYVRYIAENENLDKNNPTLGSYLRNHNSTRKPVRMNSKESLVRFYSYDFRNNCTFKKGERNQQSIFESMTFGVRDKNLVEKVRKYTLGVA